LIVIPQHLGIRTFFAVPKQMDINLTHAGGKHTHFT
jgi:hypothetical protein